jgi:uroporphyrinogen-III synthase
VTHGGRWGPTPGGPLAGRRVVVTRERPGRLAELLAERGADVVHVPLIRITEPTDRGAALRAHLDRLDGFDWLVVTSVPGAERVGAAAATATVRLAAVGRSTADRLSTLAGRPVDVVPERQTAHDLAVALLATAAPGARILLAQADRADDGLAAALRDGGAAVTVCEAYRTELVRPRPGLVDDADALLLASGSAARAWVAAVGTWTPHLVVAIGPSTAAVAREVGLAVSGVAAEHSLEGLVAETERLALEGDEP